MKKLDGGRPSALQSKNERGFVVSREMTSGEKKNNQKKTSHVWLGRVKKIHKPAGKKVICNGRGRKNSNRRKKSHLQRKRLWKIQPQKKKKTFASGKSRLNIAINFKQFKIHMCILSSLKFTCACAMCKKQNQHFFFFNPFGKRNKFRASLKSHAQCRKKKRANLTIEFESGPKKIYIPHVIFLAIFLRKIIKT